MDIITIGDFALTHADGNSTVSFRVPSARTIDYVKEIEDINLRMSKKKKIGRNDPCYCGSGKKYKHCHGK